ncbi:unnamed protein product [Peniophora sp. CBMAI 1063]|nr:unnamed protein product [Peniophora sp. CBMAI 1063]
MSLPSEHGPRAPPPRYIWEKPGSDTRRPSEARVKDGDAYMSGGPDRRHLTISTSFLDVPRQRSARHSDSSQGPSPLLGPEELSPFSRSPSSEDELEDDSASPPPLSSYPASPVDAPPSTSPMVMPPTSRTFAMSSLNGPFLHNRLPPLQLPPSNPGSGSELSPQASSLSPHSRGANPPYPSPTTRRESVATQSPQSPYYEAHGALVYSHTSGNPAFSPLSPLPPIREIKRDTVTTTATQAASANRRRNEAHFLCPVPGCGSTFTRRFNLRGHMRSHLEERPFVCEWPGCNKSFARQHDCKRHTALHTMKPKNNACRGCGKSFSRLDALNRHLRSEGGADCRLALGQSLPSLSAALSSGSSDYAELMQSATSFQGPPPVLLSSDPHRPHLHRVKTEPAPDDDLTLAPLLSPLGDRSGPASASSDSATSTTTISPATSPSTALTGSPTSSFSQPRK